MIRIVEFPTLAKTVNDCSIQAVVAMHVDLDVNFECHGGTITRVYAEL